MATTVWVILALVNIAWSQKMPTLRHEVTKLGKAVDHASNKLFKEAVMKAGDENIVSSPLGVMTLLSLYAAGAGPSLQQDIVKVLGTHNYTDLFSKYSEVSRRFDGMDKSYLSMANKIYVHENGKIAPAFSKAAETFKSEVESVDFVNSKQTVDVINKWAEEKTRGVLNQPVSQDQLTPDTVLALFNIIFFQGHWHVPFDKSDTDEHDFRTSANSTVKKPMMSLSQKLFYHQSELLDAQLVELPYQENGFRMVVVLPLKADGLPILVEKVAQYGILDEVAKMRPQRSDIHLLLPKFEVKSDLDLNNLLSKIGLGRLFTEGATGILANEAVVVSKVFQKAFIKVNEEGATAGALTGVDVVLLSWSPPIEFHADHPFLYYVLHEDIPLFIGAYRK